MRFFGFLICEVVGVDPYGSILAEPSHVNEKSNRTGQEKLLAKTSRKIGVWIVSLLVLAFDFGSDSDPLRRTFFFDHRVCRQMKHGHVIYTRMVLHFSNFQNDICRSKHAETALGL